MKQEVVAQKILAELLKRGIIKKEDEIITWEYLIQAYAAGYDEGNHIRPKKRSVTQLSKAGKVIRLHRSIKEASIEMELNVATIGRALRGDLQTAGGYRWEYTDKVKPFVETVGSIQSKSKSTPPK